jgi:hypothetical protein
MEPLFYGNWRSETEVLKIPDVELPILALDERDMDVQNRFRFKFGFNDNGHFCAFRPWFYCIKTRVGHVGDSGLRGCYIWTAIFG